MADPSHRPEGCLNTRELCEEIEARLGLRVARETVRSWANRPEDQSPLPIHNRGKAGQSHWFRWVDFLAWYDQEQIRQEALAASYSSQQGDGLAGTIDQLDWHSARTISAREQAKRDILLTAKLEGRYAEVDAMERLAEDSARQATQALLALPSKLAPRLVGLSDELEIDRLLDAEIRAVCQSLESAARRALATLESGDEAPAPAEAASSPAAPRDPEATP